MIIPPKGSSSFVMSQLKNQSASNLRRSFKWLSKVYWKENVVWSLGDFISSVGMDEETVKRYVEYQGQQEFRTVLYEAVTVRTPRLRGGIYKRL